MSHVDMSSDGLIGLDYDSKEYLDSQIWPFTADQGVQRIDLGRDISPSQPSAHGFEQSGAPETHLMVDWQFQQFQPHQYAPDNASSNPQFTSTFAIPIQPSPVDLMSAAQEPVTAGLLDTSSYSLSAPVDIMSLAYHDLPADLTSLPNGLPSVSPYAAHNMLESSSPTDSYLEVRSLNSSNSDNGWGYIEARRSVDFQFSEQSYFINPNQTLHDRSLSESSYSSSLGSSWVEIFDTTGSPTSETYLGSPYYGQMPMERRFSNDGMSQGSQSPPAVSPVAIVRPIPVPVNKSIPPVRSAGAQASSASPPSRKPSRKSPMAAKTSETRVRKQSPTGKSEPTEKKIGKRKGPLRPDQRKQASEIRKLRACLRCKFLKKTCDKGDPCAGCQPSHARLWQVPCTRIDIKEVGYFMKDWKADYERSDGPGFSSGNIKGFSDRQKTLFVTHGYGQILPINAREVYLRDEQSFNIEWVETLNRPPTKREVETAKLSAGIEGISHDMLSEYLDRHIDGNGTFEKFVDDYFDGTPFLTQILKTAFRYYFRTKLPVIHKALKLIVAYNLTLNVTMLEGIGEEEDLQGKVQDQSSKFKGKTMAPLIINFQIKCAMASMWRELQKDVLEELSSLYSSVYTGEKLKNWPTIFMLACILLAVWEEMQFDCHYRVPDAAAVEKFCKDMEAIPVGVIVGLFQAISQKLPPFTEWETQKHHHLLYSNLDVCNTMTEVRQHVTQYKSYLRSRSESKFSCNDFDCLSNKFVSRLVIRAN